ncbi:histidine phosphatase family protein [Candidatus Woesebacteria bacterium]|nr:histidine phosphatase family protein [Candidatus Woesebacteria bacterium]
MNIFIVRHGESIGNTKQGYISGRSDPDGLTQKGKVQIIRSAWELKDQPVDAIYYSPVKRAQESARIVHSLLGGSFHKADWLSELDHGMFEGKYWWEVIDQIPSSWRKKREDYRSAYPGGGESMASLGQRIWEASKDFLAHQSDSKTIVLVTHQAVIGAFRYCLQFGNPAENEKAYLQFLHKHIVPNAAVIRIKLKKNIVQWTKEQTAFDKIDPKQEATEFYAQAIFHSSRHSKTKKHVTASKNNVYQLNFGNETYLFKHMIEKSNTEVQRQLSLHTYLQSKHLPSPRIVYADQTGLFFHDPIIVQDFSTGVDQEVCFAHHTHEQGSLLKNIHTFADQIHDLPIEEVKQFWKPPGDSVFQSWKHFMHLNINLTIHFLTEWLSDDRLVTFLQEELKKLRRYAIHGQYAYTPIHGDFAPGNIIVKETKKGCALERVIDFEWARLGDPLWDFAYYGGWLDRADANLSKQWQDILKQKHSTKEYVRMEQYRLLFHAWTVRDMFEYTDSAIHKTRGEESKRIIVTLLRERIGQD